MRTRSIVTNLVWPLTILFSMASTVNGADSYLDSKIGEIRIVEGNEFLSICKATDHPCGVEKQSCSEGNREHPRATRRHATTPREILDKSQLRSRGFQWISRNGVLNLEPASRNAADILSTRLNTVSLHQISSDAAVIQVFKKAGLRFSSGGGRTGSTGRPSFAKIDLLLKDVTVRDAFNAIAKEDGHIMWIFCTDDAQKGIANIEVIGWPAGSMKESRSQVGGSHR